MLAPTPFRKQVRGAEHREANGAGDGDLARSPEIRHYRWGWALDCFLLLSDFTPAPAYIVDRPTKF